MKIIDIIGILGSILIGFSLIPQTFKSYTSNVVKSLSIFFLIITFLASLCMNIYAFYYKILPMIIANTLVFINTILLLIIYLKNKFFNNQIIPLNV